LVVSFSGQISYLSGKVVKEYHYDKGVIGCTYSPPTHFISNIKHGSPAELAGLKAGDQVLSIDGDTSPNRCAIGEANTECILIIKRKDQIFTVKIIRVEAKEFRK
jgi:predicted metalloprotease with PDZ domain